MELNHLPEFPTDGLCLQETAKAEKSRPAVMVKSITNAKINDTMRV